MARPLQEFESQFALLDRLFETTPVGLAIYDPDFRYLRINPTLAAMNGLTPEEHLGRPVNEVLPDLPAVQDALARVVATGQTIAGDIVGRTAADPGREHHWVTTYHPLTDKDGRLVGIGAAVVDVTERRVAEAALRRSRDEHRFLAEASRLLAGSLDLQATLESVADLAVPAMADWCAVDLVDEHGRACNVALAHADPGQLALARQLPPFSHRNAASTPPVARVIATGQHELYADAGEDLLREAASDEDERETWRALGIDSVLIVPMIARGRTIGAISFVTARSGRTFEAEDVAFAERLAAHCAIAVDNARLFGERAEAARQLQESLLPPGMPDLPGWELAARYRAAGAGLDVGGDFYDVFPIGRDNWLLAIGDVQGKGPGAAAVTGLARYTIRAAATRGADSAGVISALNEALLHEEEGRRFLTLVYATLELAGSAPRMVVANAGHPLPLLLRARGGVERVGHHGLLLGVAHELQLAEAPVDLEPGDALVLYTDGVIEAPGPGGQLGEDGLEELLQPCCGEPADAIADRILAAALDEAGTARDDVAVLILRRL